MLTQFKLIRNVGKFHSAKASPDLKRLTLIYAENARGKSTLSAILRSLKTGASNAILERSRLGTTENPHVVISTDSENPTHIFQSGGWNEIYPDILIYDDTFVEANVCSGLNIDSDQRKGLTGLILGSVGVSLKNKYDSLAAQIRDHNVGLTLLETKLSGIREGTPMETFCNLVAIQNIEADITQKESDLRAIQASAEIGIRVAFTEVGLPSIDKDGLKGLLTKGIDHFATDALEKLREHFNHLGKEGEPWIAQGVDFATKEQITGQTEISKSLSQSSDDPNCPFCGVGLEASSLMPLYKVYFGEEYKKLKFEISSALDSCKQLHSAAELLNFERSLSSQRGLSEFWKQFLEGIPQTLDSANILKIRQTAFEVMKKLLLQKQISPLEPIYMESAEEAAIDAYNTIREANKKTQEQLLGFNGKIEELKNSTNSSSLPKVTEELTKLRLVQARHRAEVIPVAAEYNAKLLRKKECEDSREQVKLELNEYRNKVFPTFHDEINKYLESFGTTFTISKIEERNTNSGPTCDFVFQINGSQVPLESDGSSPSFRSALSAGDRNSLALAYFFATIDCEMDTSSKVIVIDDPASSLDDSRTFATARIVKKLATTCNQVIVLSHHKMFLGKIWHNSKCEKCAFHLVREADDSQIYEWDIAKEAFTDHDITRKMLDDYLSNPGDWSPYEVAKGVRPFLEQFLRIACGPALVQPGFILGKSFINECETKLASGAPIIKSAEDIRELEALVEYFSCFHHQGGAAIVQSPINDTELGTMVKRAINYTARI